MVTPQTLAMQARLPRLLWQIIADLHHFFKFTVADSSSNEVDVLIKVTDEIKAAVTGGAGAASVTTNNAALSIWMGPNKLGDCLERHLGTRGN